MKRLMLAAVLGCALALGSLPQRAQAQVAAPTVVAVGPATPSSAKGLLALSAKLTTADGKPLSGQAIDFYMPVELFGDRDAFVGTATTDSAGGATLGYQPAQVGPQTIIARFSGVAAYAASEARAEIQVADVVPAIKAEPLPFAGLREWLPLGMLALVVLAWGVLLGVLLGTVQGIRRAV
jgi:hypothetical protein